MSVSNRVSRSAGGDDRSCSGSPMVRLPHRQYYIPSPSGSRHVLEQSPRPSSSPSCSHHFSKAGAAEVDTFASPEGEMNSNANYSSSKLPGSADSTWTMPFGCRPPAEPLAAALGEHRALGPSSSTVTTIGWQSASHLNVHSHLAAKDQDGIEGEDRAKAFANVLSWMKPVQEQMQNQTSSSTAMPQPQQTDYLTPIVSEMIPYTERTLKRCRANKTGNSPLLPPPLEVRTSPSVDFKTCGPFQWANVQSSHEELDAELQSVHRPSSSSCIVEAANGGANQDVTDHAVEGRRSTSCDSCERFSAASTDTGSSTGSASTKDVCPPIMTGPRVAAASVADAAQVLAEETDDMVASAVLDRCLHEKSCKRVIDALSVANGDVGAVLASPDLDVAVDPHHAANTAQAVCCHKDTLRNLVKVQKHCMQIEMLIQAGSLSS